MLSAITQGSMDADEPSDTGSGSVIARTLRVLDALEAEQGRLHRAVSLAEVATRAGLPSATTCRYLNFLIAHGAVRRPEGRRRRGYLRDKYTPPERALPYPSQALRRALVTLQSRTGQPALLYMPFGLAENRLRVCVDEQWGMVPTPAVEALDEAPLGIDPPGLVLAATMQSSGVPEPALRKVQTRGYAIGPSLAPGFDAIAAPLWRGPTAAGAVTLMPAQPHLQSSKVQADLIKAVMETAGTMSGHLTRVRNVRAA